MVMKIVTEDWQETRPTRKIIGQGFPACLISFGDHSSTDFLYGSTINFPFLYHRLLSVLHGCRNPWFEKDSSFLRFAFERKQNKKHGDCFPAACPPERNRSVVALTAFKSSV
jgi:hypothetical protein